MALDPHTGEVLALVGGRNYGFSQLNHAIAKRPTGSIFKPFVYATALGTGLNAQPGDPVYTQVTQIDDSPTTFEYDGKTYDPRNFKGEFYGMVTARFALQKSLNNATIKMGEMVGFDKAVSYTHLDVYKRQVPSAVAYTNGLKMEPEGRLAMAWFN